MCMSMQHDELRCAIYNPSLMGYVHNMGIASETEASATADFTYTVLPISCLILKTVHSGIKRLAHNYERYVYAS